VPRFGRAGVFFEGCMRKPFTSATSAILVLGLAVGSAGCGKYSFSSLRARKAYMEANDLYRAQDWRRAAERYEVAASSDPTLEGVFFFLGNSYDNLYKPSKQDDPENQGFIQKAIDNYKKAAQSDPNPLMRQRAMEYLVAAYAPDKLNDPSAQEPIVKQLIEQNPSEPANYFALSKIYQDSGRYEEAEQALLKAKEVRPNDPSVYTTLSAFYNSQGDFEKTMEPLHQAANLTPDSPQGFHLVATYYEEKVRKDHRLPPAQAKDYVLKGIEAEDKALSLNKDYIDAMVYKNILLRHQAKLETDRAKQTDLLKQADDLRNKAMELNKKKATGQGTGGR
jgi:tetratricopeptide (TPR) repeat protein